MQKRLKTPLGSIFIVFFLIIQHVNLFSEIKLSKNLSSNSFKTPFTQLKESKKKKKSLKKRLQNLSMKTKQIMIEKYPKAFNPSIIKIDDGYLLAFRNCPFNYAPWICYLGVVTLDENFNISSDPQLIDTHELFSKKIPSQGEDPRLFYYNEKIYLCYNDNVEMLNPTAEDRRDIFIAELKMEQGTYKLINPKKMIHQDKYKTTKWQKNWVPFVHENDLMLGYSVAPHEILLSDMESGICQTIHSSATPNHWEYGHLRGGTPAIIVDGEYLAFFHSSMDTRSPSSFNIKMRHYYMGAYTFSSTPPFKITKMTPYPIMNKNFHTRSQFNKRVIFPGGFVVDNDLIHIAYGKDDSQIWIATIKKSELKSLLAPVK